LAVTLRGKIHDKTALRARKNQVVCPDFSVGYILATVLKAADAVA
jgi:hypothetical protein